VVDRTTQTMYNHGVELDSSLFLTESIHSIFSLQKPNLIELKRLNKKKEYKSSHKTKKTLKFNLFLRNTKSFKW